MKKFSTLLVLIILTIFLQKSAEAQLTGTKTIPGDYATIAAAITDLNTQGVGAGGVIFNIAPGTTETVPAGGFVINITSNPPTSANPVVFQRNGAGVNPLIQTDAGGSGVISGTALGSNGDAMIKLVGTDFITFNNLSFQENYTGADQILKTEYCIYMVRGSSIDGCKNVTVNGCSFQQQQSNIYSSCISAANRDAAGVTTNPTDLNGRHENISIQGSSFNNSFNGMYFLGFNDPAPYELFETNINIGTITGNTLTNIGTGLTGTTTASHYGIYTQYCDSVRINNNNVKLNTGTNNATHYGIIATTALGAFVEIDGNTVSDTSLGTGQHGAIASGVGYNAAGPMNTVKITNNVVRHCFAPNMAASSSLYVYSFAGPYNLIMSNNLVDSCHVGGGTGTNSGPQYGVYSSTSQTTAGATYTIANNTVRNLSRSQVTPAAGTTYAIYILGGGATTEINNNTVNNITNVSTTGPTAGIYFSPTVTEVNVHDNTVSNLIKTATGTTGAMYAYYQSTSTPISRNYNNVAFNIHNMGTTAVTYGYYDFATAGTGVEEFYDNHFYNITSNTSGVLIGAFVSNGLSTNLQTKRASGNLIHDLNQTGTGQTGGINMNYALYGNVYDNKVFNINTNNVASAPAVYGIFMNNAVVASNYNAYNNMIHEIHAPLSGSGLGVLGMWINGGDTADVSYNSIYLDSTSTGVNFGAYALYIAGPTTATLKNNIVINKSVPVGTGSNLGIFKAATAFYGTASNNNNVYVTPGASNFIYYDGTLTHQTFANFQTAVAPAETNSFTENSPFVNVSTHPYNLDMSTTIATLCESGGIPVAGITTDIHGTTRNVTTPDVGADEFDGIGPVTLAPTLVYPSNGAVLVEVNPLMNWDAVANASTYHIQISTDSTFTTSLLDVDTVTTSQLQLGNNFLAVNTKYYWRVSGENSIGEGPFSDMWSFTTGVTNVEPTSIPMVFDLFQNYPNPFNPTTKIRFDIPKASFVSLKVYDITGREVATLVNNTLEPSRYEVEWNGSQFGSGVYFFRIQAGDFVKVQKMILTK
ncbi:MAG TPA: T9SS type A sorting domain-containing protein [Ignavibacteria bacterium]|nr:T9SS type A sorting domain-containing protein [Ignavibacteria bacterium]